MTESEDYESNIFSFTHRNSLELSLEKKTFFSYWNITHSSSYEPVASYSLFVL